jgi:hypothetical protein
MGNIPWMFGSLVFLAGTGIFWLLIKKSVSNEKKSFLQFLNFWGLAVAFTWFLGSGISFFLLWLMSLITMINDNNGTACFIVGYVAGAVISYYILNNLKPRKPKKKKAAEKEASRPPLHGHVSVPVPVPS